MVSGILFFDVVVFMSINDWLSCGDTVLALVRFVT